MTSEYTCALQEDLYDLQVLLFVASGPVILRQESVHIRIPLLVAGGIVRICRMIVRRWGES